MSGNIFEKTELFDGPTTFKGIKMWDGTKAGFSVDDLENGYIHLIRTDANKEQGYIYINGKKYGTSSNHIDCGFYQ